MRKLTIAIAIIVTLAAYLSGCFGSRSGEPPAAQMLPDLPGYTTIEGQTLTGHISTLSEGAALLAGQPELAVTVAAVDQVAGCYQEVGGARARVYSQEQEPLMAGAVAIADRNILLNPANLFRCITPAIRERTAPLVIEPCTASYTLAKDNNEFYIAYAGTTTDMCRTFCSNLEGCTAHP
jgi:hypothetical protein